MKKIYLFLMAIAPFAVFSQTYTTIASGDWLNTTNVWSTDGSTACGCTPGMTINGLDVYVNHQLTSDQNLLIDGEGSITINNTGTITLDGSNTVIQIHQGHIDAFGDVFSKKLTIDAGGSMLLSNAEMTIETRAEIFGELEIDFANFILVMGNLHVQEGGTLNVHTASKIYLAGGNFENWGETTMGEFCCMELGTGNVKNEITGSIYGEGAFISDVGNIQNENYWGPDVMWCSAGSDFGMPHAEECTESYANCAFAPLPVEIVSFEGQAKKGFNEIEWVTAAELNCDYYMLERSEDGKNWESIARVDGNGTTDRESEYTVQDLVNSPKLYYYRLIQFDFNADKKESRVISVESVKVSTVCVYPNPSDGRFYVLLDQMEPGVKVNIFDLNGNPVHEVPEVNGKRIEVDAPLNSGIYIVHIDKNGKDETVKIVVK